jgi:hypothetical protein
MNQFLNEDQNLKGASTCYLSDNDSLSNEQKKYIDNSAQTDAIVIINQISSFSENKNDFLKKKKIFNINIPFIEKKPSGRKKKNDITKGSHTKYSKDNCIYKIKNKTVNCIIYTLNRLLKVYFPDREIKKIASSIFKDGSKHFNLKLLNMKISDILLLKVSSKYSNDYNNNNKEIIEKLKDINLFNEILNMTFEDSIHKLFMMSSNDYKAKYSFENKFLFEKMGDKDKEEIIALKNLIENGLINYFEHIKSRKIRKIKDF